MNYATISLKNHLTSAGLKMFIGEKKKKMLIDEADTISLVSKSSPQMIRHFLLLLIIIHHVFK